MSGAGAVGARPEELAALFWESWTGAAFCQTNTDPGKENLRKLRLKLSID